MATQLSLYNEALRICGERRLVSPTENRNPRYYLDDVWDEDALGYCLEQGFWNFAMRTAILEYDPSFTPAFGYQYAFEKPSDFVRTAAMCTDEYLNNPLLRYEDEGGFWFADQDVIYVKYVSDDNAYGKDMSLFPRSYEKFVAAYLASEIVERLTQNDAKVDMVMKKMEKRLVDARSKDAMESPTKFPAEGSWTRARRGRMGSRSYDRGSRNNLIG